MAFIKENDSDGKLRLTMGTNLGGEASFGSLDDDGQSDGENTDHLMRLVLSGASSP